MPLRKLLEVIDGKDTLLVVDTHTAGEPTRILLDANTVAPLEGDTMVERHAYASMHWEQLRRRLLHEPRGHADMFGAAVLPSVDYDAGVLFFGTAGFLSMCVHGSMAVARVLASSLCGRHSLRLDTAAGVVEATISSDPLNSTVTLRNVPSFVTALDQQVTVSGRAVKFDVAFGGNFAALVDAKNLGLQISEKTIPQLRKLGRTLLELINHGIQVQHPTQRNIRGVTLAYFYEMGDDPTRIRNLVVFGNGQLDRSPCGTGSSALLVTLIARGCLGPLQRCTIRSPIGGEFIAHVEGHESGRGVHKYPLFDPYLTGSSYITGINRLVFERVDPFIDGFVL